MTARKVTVLTAILLVNKALMLSRMELLAPVSIPGLPSPWAGLNSLLSSSWRCSVQAMKATTKSVKKTTREEKTCTAASAASAPMTACATDSTKP